MSLTTFERGVHHITTAFPALQDVSHIVLKGLGKIVGIVIPFAKKSPPGEAGIRDKVSKVVSVSYL